MTLEHRLGVLARLPGVHALLEWLEVRRLADDTRRLVHLGALLVSCGVCLVAAFSDRLAMSLIALAVIVLQLAIGFGARLPRLRRRRGAPLHISSRSRFP